MKSKPVQNLQNCNKFAKKIWDARIRAAEHVKALAKEVKLPALGKLAHAASQKSDEAIDTHYAWRTTWGKWKRVRDLGVLKKSVPAIVREFKKYLKIATQQGEQCELALKKVEEELAKLGREHRSLRNYKRALKHLKVCNNWRDGNGDYSSQEINNLVSDFEKHLVQDQINYLTKMVAA